MLVDEYKRECVSIDAGRSICLRPVIEVVSHELGIPEHLRFGNGLEFIARKLQERMPNQGKRHYYQPKLVSKRLW
jgi:hypothetical protein